jgi:hypothetical protein
MFCHFSAIEAHNYAAASLDDFAICMVTPVVVNLTLSDTRLLVFLPPENPGPAATIVAWMTGIQIAEM